LFKKAIEAFEKLKARVGEFKTRIVDHEVKNEASSR
jgi:hypothetical protein